jgi:hypothetical protein
MRLTPRRTAAVLGTIAVLALAAPAGAIKFGQPDNEEHPYVGELLFYVPDAIDSRFDDPGGWFSCTGSLVSPTIVVTAGHCTFAVGLDGVSTTNGGEATTTAEGGDGGNDVWVDFSEEAHFDGFPASADYDRDENQERYDDRSAWLNDQPDWHKGVAHPHPLYDDNAFFHHDGGVVVLDEPFELDEYATLPEEGYADRYATRRGSGQQFEVVGYGLTSSLPVAQEGGDVRLKALTKLNTTNGSDPKNAYLIFSNNPGVHVTGGTCFGDSGGPILDGTDSTLIVAVNSFAFSNTCSGASGGYRIDQEDDIEFLAEFGVGP